MPGAVVARGDRVTLRTIETEDSGFVQRGTANPEIRYPLGARLRSRGEIEAMEDVDGDHLLVCVEEGDADPGRPEADAVRRVGKVSVTEADWRRPDLGYWVAPEDQGQGYGKAAVALVVDYAFRTYEHPAVGAVVYEFNDASRGLLESLGFEQEGRVRRDRFVDGAYVDTLHYGLLREEWRGE